MIIASSGLLEEAIFFATRKRLKEVSHGYAVTVIKLPVTIIV